MGRTIVLNWAWFTRLPQPPCQGHDCFLTSGHCSFVLLFFRSCWVRNNVFPRAKLYFSRRQRTGDSVHYCTRAGAVACGRSYSIRIRYVWTQIFLHPHKKICGYKILFLWPSRRRPRRWILKSLLTANNRHAFSMTLRTLDNLVHSWLV